MALKILIVEDDNYINDLISESFSREGYECVQAFSGTEGLLYARGGGFDLVITDIMLPGIDGGELIGKIKSISEVPVIVISALDALDTKVKLLTEGAEDYMTKPFEMRELIARAAVQIRRFSKDANVRNVITYRGLRLDKSDHSLTVSGSGVSLTKLEFKILELLMSYPSRIFSKQDIYDYAWEDYYIGEDKTVNVHIGNIRRKIKAVSGEDWIETVWGVGFRLIKS